MSLRIKLKTFKMTGEDQQLEEIIDNAKAAKNGETTLFPEFGVYIEPCQQVYGVYRREM